MSSLINGLKYIIHNPIQSFLVLLPFAIFFAFLYYRDLYRQYGSFGASHRFARKACELVKKSGVGGNSFPAFEFCQFLESCYIRIVSTRDIRSFRYKCEDEYHALYLFFEFSYEKSVEINLYPSRYDPYRGYLISSIEYLKKHSYYKPKLLDRALCCVNVTKNIFIDPDYSRLDFGIFGPDIPEYFLKYTKE